DQQCRHHQAYAARQYGWPVGGGFPAHLRREHDRAFPDGAGRALAAGSGGALNTMTLSLARALAPLIRVNTVCPGYIDTPWFTKGRGVDGAAKVRDSVVAKVPLKRASTADDVAGVVCFLATQQSSNMTGEVLRIDAGAHLITGGTSFRGDAKHRTRNL